MQVRRRYRNVQVFSNARKEEGDTFTSQTPSNPRRKGDSVLHRYLAKQGQKIITGTYSHARREQSEAFTPHTLQGEKVMAYFKVPGKAR